MSDAPISLAERAVRIGHNITVWKHGIERRITQIERYLMQRDDSVDARLKMLEDRLATLEQSKPKGAE